MSFCGVFAGAGDLRPDRVKAEPRPGARWVCSYCRGVRLGASCSGCGAPQQAGLQLRPTIGQPVPDVR